MAILKTPKVSRSHRCEESEDNVSKRKYRVNLQTCKRRGLRVEYCWGYEYVKNKNRKNECSHFRNHRPKIGNQRKGAICAIIP